MSKLFLCPKCGGFDIEGWANRDVYHVKCSNFLFNVQKCDWSQDFPSLTDINQLSLQNVQTPFEVELKWENFYYDVRKYKQVEHPKINVKCFDSNGHKYTFSRGSACKVIYNAIKQRPFIGRVSIQKFVTNLKPKVGMYPHSNGHSLLIKKSASQYFRQVPKLLEIR